MIEFIKCFLIVVLFSIAGIVEAHAATIDAKTCSREDVQAAIDAANDGDTVKVPAGECTWTAQVKIGEIIWTTPATYKSKRITLQGAGTDKTIITDEIPKNGREAEILLRAFGVEGKSFRITGFTIRGGATDIGWNGAIAIGGTSKSWRIDHIKFENLKTRAIRIGGNTYGVIDHNIFNLSTSAIYASYSGDSSWNSPLSLGTEEAVYMEDNVFDFASAASSASIDAGGGARYVFRYNMTNSTAINHGTETTGRSRSAFSYEVYNNTFANTQEWWSAMHFRGGTGVIFNNTLTGYGALAHVANYRDSTVFKFWGACDGTSPYDRNDGITYDSGTHSGTDASRNLVDNRREWNPDQWRGYSLHNTVTGNSGIILSNTQNTITTASNQYATSLTFNNGDGYKILRASVCLDQVGRSTGNLLSNYDPPLPQEWPQQILAPLYEWSNTLNGVNADIKSDSPHIRKNRDFYTIPASRVGPLSALPPTCIPYEGYFATDENTLYKCTAPDTWTAYYTPYKYPHPLTVNNPPRRLRFE